MIFMVIPSIQFVLHYSISWKQNISIYHYTFLKINKTPKIPDLFQQIVINFKLVKCDDLSETRGKQHDIWAKWWPNMNSRYKNNIYLPKVEKWSKCRCKHCCNHSSHNQKSPEASYHSTPTIVSQQINKIYGCCHCK